MVTMDLLMATAVTAMMVFADAHTQTTVVAVENESAELHCHHTTPVLMWLLTNGEVLHDHPNDSKSDNNRFLMGKDGVLNITSLQQSDDGHYICVVKKDSKMHAFAVYLRVESRHEGKSQLHGDRTRLAIALCAAAVIAGISAFICTLYHNRKHEDEQPFNYTPGLLTMEMERKYCS